MYGSLNTVLVNRLRKETIKIIFLIKKLFKRDKAIPVTGREGP
jgi:hypothetical protein